MLDIIKFIEDPVIKKTDKFIVLHQSMSTESFLVIQLIFKTGPASAFLRWISKSIKVVKIGKEGTTHAINSVKVKHMNYFKTVLENNETML
jgi:hypothetical protein